MAKPSISTQITIDSTNKYLDVTSGAGGDETVTLTEQDYDDMVALCSAIQTGLQALGGTWASATCAVSYTTTPVGKVVIDSQQAGDTCGLEWATGTNAANTVGDILGFDTSADDTGAYSYTSDYQHQYGWYATRAPVRYSKEDPIQIGGDLRIPLSGKSAKIVHVGYQHRYKVELALILPECMYSDEATDSNTNRDLETEWQRMAQGQWFRWREDQTVEGTSTDFYLIEPRDWGRAVTRPHIDYEAYNIAMTFSKKES